MNSDIRNTVLASLKDAASQDPSVMKSAERQLEVWQEQQGFHSALMEVVLDSSADQNVRWMAVIYLKQGLEKYWRKTAPNSVIESEKIFIKQGLLQCFRESVPQIAIQQAVLISRLARVEFPKNWPELFPAISEQLQSPEILVQHRALLILHHVVKQLASKRLISDRKCFQELSSQIFSHLLQLWRLQSAAVMNLESKSEEFVNCFERARLSLKILRRLCVHGFKDHGQQTEVGDFLNAILQQIKPLVSVWMGFDAVGKDSFGKFVALHMKVLYDFLESHPLPFKNYIKPTLEICCYYIFTEEGHNLQFEKLLLQCFSLVKAIIVCREYRPSFLFEESDSSEIYESHKIKKEFFTEKVVSHMCRDLISHHFLLNPEALHSWDTNPEEYYLEDNNNDAYRYCLRPCIVDFFVTLLSDYTDYMIPCIIDMIAASRSLVRSDDINALLKKDAIYNAASLAVFDVSLKLDFESWLSDTLIHEMKIQDSNYRILRRRTLVLISKWSNYASDDQQLPLVFEAILHLLSDNEDLVVRLTAANSLRESIDDFGATSEKFMPYLPTSMNLLLKLLKSVSECETKLHVLRTMTMVISVCGECSQVSLKPCLEYMPELWTDSEYHSMLRCAVISHLAVIVTAIKIESESIHDFLAYVIKFSSDINEKDHVYLCEEGLELWSTVLVNCRHPSEVLLSIFGNALAIMEESTEHLETCLSITKAYIILCPDTFLTRYGERLIRMSLYLMTDLKSEGVICVLKMFETMMKVLPKDAPTLLRPALTFFVSKLVKQDDLSNADFSMYYSIAARLVLYDNTNFYAAIEEFSHKQQRRPEEIFEQVVRLWAGNLNSMYPIERQKLGALGLSELCGSGHSAVIKYWPEAISAVCSVIFDLSDTDDGTNDNLVVSKIEDQESLFEDDFSEHSTRVAAITRRELIYTTSLRDFLGQHLKVLQQSVGSAVITELMTKVDPDCHTILRGIL